MILLHAVMSHAEDSRRLKIQKYLFDQLFLNFDNHYYYTYLCGQGDPH